MHTQGPIFHCAVTWGAWPATLYLTYWHLCLVTSIIGLRGSTIAIPLRDVIDVEVHRSWLGRAYTKVILKEENINSDAIDGGGGGGNSACAAQDSDSNDGDNAGSECGRDKSCGGGSGGNCGGGRSDNMPASVAFTPSVVSAARLRDLLVATLDARRSAIPDLHPLQGHTNPS